MTGPLYMVPDHVSVAGAAQERSANAALFNTADHTSLNLDPGHVATRAAQQRKPVRVRRTDRRPPRPIPTASGGWKAEVPPGPRPPQPGGRTSSGGWKSLD